MIRTCLRIDACNPSANDAVTITEKQATEIPADAQVKSDITVGHFAPGGKGYSIPDPVDQPNVQIAILNITDCLITISKLDFCLF